MKDAPDPDLVEVVASLSEDPPQLSPVWFYDAVGSALFEAITRLPDYAVTRGELALLQEQGTALGAALPRGAMLVELGAGSGAKARLLLAALRAPVGYLAIDVSHAALEATLTTVRESFPTLVTRGWCADFTHLESHPGELLRRAAGGPAVLFFPGSTLGNFGTEDACSLLDRLAREVPAGTRLLVGLDLVKPKAQLLRAYDDPVGVTAAFNRNALAHLNARFDAGFDPAAWRHEARWDAAGRRVQMYLVAERHQRIRLGEVDIDLPAGTAIHTEDSHKFERGPFEELAQNAGWDLDGWWEEPESAFAEALLVRISPR